MIAYYVYISVVFMKHLFCYRNTTGLPIALQLKGCSLYPNEGLDEVPNLNSSEL